MTLMDFCAIALSDCGLVVPAGLIGNTDETALRTVAAAQLAGKSLQKAPPNGWVANVREFDFRTAALPNQTGTITDNGDGTSTITGLASVAGVAPLTWQVFGTGVPRNAQVQSVTGGTIVVNRPSTVTGPGEWIIAQSDYAVPADFHRPLDATLWDRSRFWSLRGPQSPQQWQLFKSSVVGRASIQRRFRFRWVAGARVFSIDPVPTDNGAELVYEYISNGWCQSTAGSVQTQWMADSDTTLLDEDLMMLAVRWRVKRGLGFAYQEELGEYEYELRKAISVDGGAAILDLAPSERLTLLGPWNIPETGFGVGSVGVGVVGQ